MIDTKKHTSKSHETIPLNEKNVGIESRIRELPVIHRVE
jgi:hypothetical protein